MDKNPIFTFDLFNPTQEHSMLRRSLGTFVEKEVEPQANEHNRAERFNLTLFRKLGDLGLLGITAPEAYGGSGFDSVAAVIAHEELSTSDPGFALAYLSHSMLCVNNIAINAEESQKAQILPKLCSGEWIGAMGLSEPGAGTDVRGMSTTAVRDGSDYIINGRKMWITNGAIDDNHTPCHCLLLYAKTGEENDGRAKISTFIITEGTPGFTVGQKITDKTGVRASITAELCFDDCKVPESMLVGKEGDSLTHMMRNLEIERLTLAAMGLGIARRALEIMISYSKERKAFGSPLHNFGQIQAHIGNSYAEYNAARCYVYNAARLHQLDKTYQRLDSDGAKLIAAPTAKRIADRAMQVLGGYGYVGEYIVERLWRDAKLLEIGGGTLESHQKNITRDLVKD